MRPFDFEQAALASRRLSGCLDRLGELDVRLHHGCRLYEAVRVLNQVAQTKRYPDGGFGVRRLSGALLAAQCLIRTVDALPDEPPPGITHAIKRMGTGRLTDVGATQAHRAQSELFFGLSLLLSGVELRSVYPTDDNRPEYLVDYRTLRMAVEVKRPASYKKLLKHLGKAADQIAALPSLPGIIGFDLTDLLERSIDLGYLNQALDPGDDLVDRVSKKLATHISSYQSKAKYSRVAIICCYVTPVIWSGYKGEVIPFLGFVAKTTRFARANSGLVERITTPLAQGLETGFAKMGGGPLRVPPRE